MLQQLEELLPGVNIDTRTLYAAVNQGYAKRESVLQDGDEVAFFPPVSGGA
ncbi:MAG: MoaD/ThiS family protein [Caldilineaceae bacterium]